MFSFFFFLRRGRWQRRVNVEAFSPFSLFSFSFLPGRGSRQKSCQQTKCQALFFSFFLFLFSGPGSRKRSSGETKRGGKGRYGDGWIFPCSSFYVYSYSWILKRKKNSFVCLYKHTKEKKILLYAYTSIFFFCMLIHKHTKEELSTILSTLILYAHTSLFYICMYLYFLCKFTTFTYLYLV
jgi:hypothetical protein